MLLGDLGAQVIKSSGRRKVTIPVPLRPRFKATKQLISSINRNKKSITLDMKS